MIYDNLTQCYECGHPYSEHELKDGICEECSECNNNFEMENIKCITFDKKAQDSLPEHIKAKMKADREKARNPEIPCGICENTHVRTAITYNSVKVCHNCMDFLKRQAELNNRYWEEEISHQTKHFSNGG